MKKVLAAIILLVLSGFIPAHVFAEEIEKFSAEIFINSDGTVNVNENIDYNFGSTAHHGIIRTIPFIKKSEENKKFILDIHSFAVYNQSGASYKFEKTVNGDNYQLKIGDPAKTLTGLNNYLISYQAGGALTYFSDHDEFYWNITGSDWQVPISQVQAEITLPQPVNVSQIKTTCYTGALGSQSQNCIAKYLNGKIIAQSTVPFKSYEGLTLAVAFPKNLAAVLEPKPYQNFWDTKAGKITAIILGALALIIGLAWYILLPLWVILNWYKYGRDPEAPFGAAHVWFDVPKTSKLRKLTPGETGTLIDETADLRDISATIVDLARRGYLKIIEKKENDFYLVKLKDCRQDRELQFFETHFLEEIFKKEKEIRIKDFSFYEIVSETKKNIYESLVKAKFFPENPESIRSRYFILACAAFITFNYLLAIIAFIFGRAMPRKTLFGAGQANIAAALRRFLISQKNKLSFQARNQMFFEKLLPWAVAFGAEKVWAQRFSDIAMKPPSWYEPYDHSSFNSIVFINSLNNSNHILTKAVSAGSHSGFSSGFSGGSSGGGGGGGGGGSW